MIIKGGMSADDTRRWAARTELSPATFAFSELLIFDARIFLPTLMAPFRTAFALYDYHGHAGRIKHLTWRQGDNVREGAPSLRMAHADEVKLGGATAEELQGMAIPGQNALPHGCGAD